MKTSAFGQKADIVSGAQNVRYWPLADIGSCAANVEAQETDRDRTQEARHFDQLPSAEASLERSWRLPKVTKTFALRSLGKARHRPPSRTKGASGKAVGRRRRHMFPAGKMTILYDHTAPRKSGSRILARASAFLAGQPDYIARVFAK